MDILQSAVRTRELGNSQQEATKRTMSQEPERCFMKNRKQLNDWMDMNLSLKDHRKLEKSCLQLVERSWTMY